MTNEKFRIIMHNKTMQLKTKTPRYLIITNLSTMSLLLYLTKIIIMIKKVNFEKVKLQMTIGLPKVVLFFILYNLFYTIILFVSYVY